MDLSKLLENTVQDFIHRNKDADVAELGLKKMPDPNWPRSEILQQIQSLQKAQNKLDKWTTRKGIIFPKYDLIEQSSSDKTADYKASIVKQGNLFIDLTTGLGNDTIALSKNFKTGICVEADETSCELLKNNLPLLTDTKIDVHHGKAEDLLKSLPNADLIYIDPQRRSDSGKKGLFQFEKMSPNILTLLPELMKKSRQVLIKTSPFMDIKAGLDNLKDVREIYVIESNKQCKEILYLIESEIKKERTEIFCKNLDSGFVYSAVYPQSTSASISFSDPLRTLYEPSPSLMKSGLHTNYALEHNLLKLAPQTHLYTSDQPAVDYPGRALEILDILPVDRKKILSKIPNSRASISTRNFPQDTETLRKQLGLKDGGDHVLFACTLQNGQHCFILCRPQQLQS